MFSVNNLMAVIQLSDKIFSTHTLRKLGTWVTKIASLKTKLKHKCSVSQFQLEWCNKQEKVWAEKTFELSLSRQEEEGVGPGRTRVEPTQQVGQDRGPSWESPPTCQQPADCAHGLLPCAEQLPRSWRSITVSSADCSRKPRHFCTYQIYIHKVPSSYTCYCNYVT